MRFPPNNLGSKVVIQKVRSKRHYSELKKKIRKDLIQKRKLFHLHSLESANDLARNLIHFLNSKNFSITKKNIAIYWPIGSEIDTKPSIAALAEFGATISLASTENGDIKYRLWTPDTRIDINKLGIIINSKEVKSPDIIICPLIGFDKDLNRLGRGGGYYDKSLYEYKNIIKIGFAYSIQQIKMLPIEKHDVNMDVIITEKHIFNKMKTY